MNTFQMTYAQYRQQEEAARQQMEEWWPVPCSGCGNADPVLVQTLGFIEHWSCTECGSEWTIEL